jgi:hypothetical protein
MKKRYSGILLALCTILCFASCEKEYTCRCSGAEGSTDVMTIKGKRKDAYNQCNDYAVKNAGRMPKNATFCALK